MLTQLLSGDLPRSRVLSALLIAVTLYLATAPFMFSSARSLNVAATICVFLVLVASYDLHRNRDHPELVARAAASASAPARTGRVRRVSGDAAKPPEE